MNQKFLVLDYETRSLADLKAVGAYEYSVHPSTKIMCAAFRLGTKEELRTAETKIWSPAFPAENGAAFAELVRALLDPSIRIVAHNAFFEQVITRNVLGARLMYSKRGLQEIPHERWICTAARAAALALPRDLGSACDVLELPIRKDEEGRKLMLKYAKPRKPTKSNPSVWLKSAADLRRIMEYCRTDIAAEVELFLATPSLNAFETKVWAMDQRMNFKGLRVDRPLVKAVLKMVDEEVSNLDRLTSEMTGGHLKSTTQRAKLLAYIQERGGMLPNLQKKTVEDALAARLLDEHCSELLTIRQAVSKTSTAKYGAFWDRSQSDGRVRDTLMYHGASTGRWAGQGLQIQNFPRGTMKVTEPMIAEIMEGDLEWLRLRYGNPMELFSSALRGAILPSEGHELFVGDYATIEARVLFWIARHERGLQDFRDGVDGYRKMGAVIFNKPLEAVTKESYERQVGKAAFLGCGFQMGWKKFIDNVLKTTGIKLTEPVAKKAVNGYRTEHAPVPKVWSNFERAAIAAVRNPGKVFTINRTKWFCKDGFLWAEIPGGRRLAYFKPSIKMVAPPWEKDRELKDGEVRQLLPKLYHWSVDPKTHQWVNGGTYGGKLTENVVQAIARDLMCFGMLEFEKAGYTPIGTVHDEGLSERPIGTGSVEEFEALMGKNPPWAGGLPIKVEGWKGPRYRK